MMSRLIRTIYFDLLYHRCQIVRKKGITYWRSSWGSEAEFWPKNDENVFLAKYYIDKGKGTK